MVLPPWLACSFRLCAGGLVSLFTRTWLVLRMYNVIYTTSAASWSCARALYIIYTGHMCFHLNVARTSCVYTPASVDYVHKSSVFGINTVALLLLDPKTLHCCCDEIMLLPFTRTVTSHQLPFIRRAVLPNLIFFCFRVFLPMFFSFHAILPLCSFVCRALKTEDLRKAK